MKTVDTYIARYRDTVQAAVPDEQVLAVGILSRPGSLADTAVLKVSGLAFLVRNAAAKQASLGLPQNVAVAVTPTRVLFFAFRPKMQSIVLKGLVRSIPRAGLGMRLERATLATRVVFTLPDGTSFELDSNRNVGQYQRLNEPFLSELA